jgi:hypothetical protein
MCPNDWISSLRTHFSPACRVVRPSIALPPHPICVLRCIRATFRSSISPHPRSGAIAFIGAHRHATVALDSFRHLQRRFAFRRAAAQHHFGIRPQSVAILDQHVAEIGQLRPIKRRISVFIWSQLPEYLFQHPATLTAGRLAWHWDQAANSFQ